ncbi:hypothetical protein SmJEL517_g00152 [Synchytrium microbalum]|uniref:Uncharacterized protein n=1 Tax=Synchytrium microbalum TaxID=1806994 RepID=A0A507CJX1_9FUNG|nr:uncharacterized protein SmJEL517_g00152 [Synchytrium microbalum]TPX38165.1 hypothetical protein SmJEL517_g00152 [Synchytrium microbalum]
MSTSRPPSRLLLSVEDPTIKQWLRQFPPERRSIILARSAIVGIAALNGDTHEIDDIWDDREKELFGGENVQEASPTLVEIHEDDENYEEGGRAAGIKTTVRIVPRPGDPTSYWTYPSWLGHREHLPSQGPPRSRKPMQAITNNHPVPTNANDIGRIVKRKNQGTKNLIGDAESVNWTFPKRMIDEGTQTLTDAFTRPRSPVRKPAGWGKQALWYATGVEDEVAETEEDRTAPSTARPSHDDVRSGGGVMYGYGIPETSRTTNTTRPPLTRIPKTTATATSTYHNTEATATTRTTSPERKSRIPAMTSPERQSRKPAATTTTRASSPPRRTSPARPVLPPVSFTVTPPRHKKRTVRAEKSSSATSSGGGRAARTMKDTPTFVPQVISADEDFGDAEEASAVEIALKFMDSDFLKCLDMNLLDESEDDVENDYQMNQQHDSTGLHPHL